MHLHRPKTLPLYSAKPIRVRHLQGNDFWIATKVSGSDILVPDEEIASWLRLHEVEHVITFEKRVKPGAPVSFAVRLHIPDDTLAFEFKLRFC